MELIVFIGLQGSGKSTFYHTYFAATHDHISKDLLGNKQRPGKAKVPDVAIYATNKNLESPPYAEGFDKIYRVRTASNPLFEVNACSVNTLMPPQSHPSKHLQLPPPIETPGPHPAKQN